ncbi:Friend of PRMT1 duplication [Plasmopara halstedii]|uniref:Friend of PRMT1 duplication n=1 Tax=Plasmopara halstedii TaxID=4781 RepID=A0A0P1B043_PLAHL|nr:Friend of PRMT1 duplication [Plasmopara halstedii]CEG48106.1 Friend of PRMT1 duplication [Plasmopara halstedii]|eukprot:XP_024584475.1 Friend of PRMT1 duplication [Plasmopara halstedii]
MYRRAGAPRASVRGHRTIDQQHSRGKKMPRSVVGVSSIPLSSRFTSLAEETAPLQARKQQHHVTVVKVKKDKAQPIVRVSSGVKKANLSSTTRNQIHQKTQKLQQVAQNNRNKRLQIVTKRRKGLVPLEAIVKGNQNQPLKSSTLSNQQKGGRGAGHGGRGGRGSRGSRGGRGGRGGRVGQVGRGSAKAKLPTGDDLDMELDEYWHTAGKGPDPKAAQLDRQMEEYWAAKPALEKEKNYTLKTEADAPPDAPMK